MSDRDRPFAGAPDRGQGRGRIGHGGTRRDTSPDRRSAQRPSERARSTDWARRVAFDVMRRVDDGAYANVELPQQLRRRRLSGRDAAFATELVYGTCRWRGLYDAVVQRCFDRPLADIDGPVLDALRLGVHQLLSTRVPPHAAVSQTVGLAREAIGIGAGGFVNAILRKVTEKDRDAWVAEIAAEIEDPIARLAGMHSHPEWMVRALRSALLTHEASTAESVDEDLAALLASHNESPRVALAARPGLADLEDLIVEGAVPSDLSPVGAVLDDGGDPGALPDVRSGRVAVQDEGSQLVALAVLNAQVDKPHGRPERWLDMCAGPGGKVGLLAAASLSTGAEVYANEVSEHRTELVNAAVRSAVAEGAQVMVGCDDGRTIGEEEPAFFDRVLLDAPCSGLGSLRRRPDARWRRQPSDVADLAVLQRELLESAIAATREGGVVAYATCTPHPAETAVLVRDVVRRRDDVVVEDAQPLFRGPNGDPITQVGPAPFVQLWPHIHGCDAMFFALIRKRAGASVDASEKE